MATQKRPVDEGCVEDRNQGRREGVCSSRPFREEVLSQQVCLLSQQSHWLSLAKAKEIKGVILLDLLATHSSVTCTTRTNPSPPLGFQCLAPCFREDTYTTPSCPGDCRPHRSARLSLTSVPQRTWKTLKFWYECMKCLKVLFCGTTEPDKDLQIRALCYYPVCTM